MTEMIKNMPPLLKEEIIGVSLAAIKEEAMNKIMKEMKRSASIVVDDITDCLIESRKTGKNWKRPEYTKDIDDELYYTFVNIAEQFVNKHVEKLVFDQHGDTYDRDY